MKGRLMKTTLVFAASLIALNYHQCQGHIEMMKPPPRRSRFNSDAVEAGTVDWTNTSPLSPGGFPCKGYPAGRPIATLRAGQPVNIELYGSSTHGGGHCQVAISYDEKHWVTIKTIIHDCMVNNNMTIVAPVPAHAPSSEHAVLAWTWINANGNREYYMNCADVRIEGDGSDKNGGGTITGPELLVANLPGTPRIPEFPVGGDSHELFSKRPMITITASPASPAPVLASTPVSASASASASAPVKKNTPPRNVFTGSRKSNGANNNRSMPAVVSKIALMNPNANGSTGNRDNSDNTNALTLSNVVSDINVQSDAGTMLRGYMLYQPAISTHISDNNAPTVAEASSVDNQVPVAQSASELTSDASTSTKAERTTLEKHTDNVMSITTLDDIVNSQVVPLTFTVMRSVAPNRATCQGENVRKTYKRHQQNSASTIIDEQSNC